MENKKLKIAWFSELPSDIKKQETESLSSYFTKEVLPYLKNKFEITLYHNSFDKFQDFKTFHYLKAFENDKNSPYDIFFYQLEDSSRLNFVRSHLGLIPGITYFHHFNLTNFGPEPLLNSPYSDIVEIYNNKKYGSSISDWPDRRNKYKPKGPAAFREAALSAVSVFSTAQSLNEYKNQIKLKIKLKEEASFNAFYLPYPVKPKTSECNLNNDLFTVSFIGSTRIERRAHKVLSAISASEYDILFRWLLPANENNEAKLLLEEFGIQNYEIFNQYNSDTWRDIVRTSDCAVHTLFSVYGHNEPYLGISLSEGKTSIVTDFASTENLPENIVFKVQPGDNESAQIAEIIKSIKSEPFNLCSASLENYAAEMYNPAQIASELSDIFLRRRDYLKQIRNEWDLMNKTATQALISEADSFIEPAADDFRNLLKPSLEELGWIR